MQCSGVRGRLEPLNPTLTGVPRGFHANLQAFHVVFALLMEMPYVRYPGGPAPGGWKLN